MIGLCAVEMRIEVPLSMSAAPKIRAEERKLERCSPMLIEPKVIVKLPIVDWSAV